MTQQCPPQGPLKRGDQHQLLTSRMMHLWTQKKSFTLRMAVKSSEPRAVICTTPVYSGNQLNISDIYSFTTYNANGLAGQGSPVLGELCQPACCANNSADNNNSNNAFILIQEHWLTPASMHLIERFHNDYTAFGVSAMEGAVERSVLCGRPLGG